MWPFEIINDLYTILALGTHSFVGIGLVLCLFHAVVGRSGYVYLAVIVALATLSAAGSTKIFMMFGTFPVMGGSLYMPILFGIVSMCSFEMPNSNARGIMFCALIALGLMALTDVQVVAYDYFHPGTPDLEYSAHVGNLTVLFVSGVVLYFDMNVRLSLTAATKCITLPMRYVYVLSTLAAATVIQLVTYHLEYVQDNPEVIVYTILLRFTVSGGVGITYWWRFNGRPPMAASKEKRINAALSEKRRNFWKR